ncbi:hypothetical protein MMC18_000609 [Xylographa bjoerkii]|nr:hypothetical protein [Xylographa bjoerkii]
MTAVSSATNGGGIVQSHMENGRWGYVREDDNDKNSSFVFSQILPPSQPSPTKDVPLNYEQRINNERSPLQAQGHNTSASANFAFQDSLPQPEHSSNSDPADRRPNTLETTRQRLGDSSRNGSEADSLLDLYRQQKIGQSGAHNSTTNGAMAPYLSASEEVDKEKWIHRDKLAVIESQEAQAAGVQIPHDFNVQNQQAHYNVTPHVGPSREQGYASGRKDEMRNRNMRSPSPAMDADYSGDDDTDHDLRMPDEIAADSIETSSSPRIYSQYGLRASSSRIPIATSSPLPISQEHLERNIPLPRKRGVSGSYDEDGLIYRQARSRSHSVGSQVLLDDAEYSNSAPSSPSKIKAPAKSQQISSAKKPLTGSRNVSATQKVRSISSTARGSPAQRPATRSGAEGRPATAINRPEGDAPWLADMYKPDPHLPQDQQIIPTHAKRLQQEQWDRVGRPSNGFSWDIEQSAEEIDEQNQAPPIPPADTVDHTADDGGSAWPFKAPEIEPAKTSRSPAPGSEHAGYSTIPKLHNTPLVGSIQSPRLPQPMEVQEPKVEPPQKESGCGCCTVM